MECRRAGPAAELSSTESRQLPSRLRTPVHRQRSGRRRGEVETLLSAVADKGLDGYVRWALLGALARLAFDGAVSHATAPKVLESFERDGWAEPGDAA